eukprot:CAMPEP_0185857452 /NCGR_PEP_ID=MMETSP1354-20130828/29512_1 /TAXON_ID=708628 /ORGANISM="Erythrolobus madagascarensis, Strain CCMP3276" /LENGTH=430 /DNA_ID=CAMNT_0028559723 /DNA_START=114 /DNA_END=1406 /DNA_ORIENTATION=-
MSWSTKEAPRVVQTRAAGFPQVDAENRARVWAVLGSGNGGKTSAAELSLQGMAVRLWEFPQWSSNIHELIRANPRAVLHASGALNGDAPLELVTDDIAVAVQGAHAIMCCLQADAINLLADHIFPFVCSNVPIILNPGSTGGALVLAKQLRKRGVSGVKMPPIVELGTLLYGTRAQGSQVSCAVLVQRVEFGVFPASRMNEVAPMMGAHFGSRLVPASSGSALEAGFANANPVIHPAITLLNVGAMEIEGASRRFYRDNVSPMVADMIRKVDLERMALMNALGFDVMSDALNSKLQGYAESDDYYECYAHGSGFAQFTCPATDLRTHRYFEEDVGVGLVFFVLLGKQLGVPTPASFALVSLATQLAEKDFLSLAKKSPQTLGIEGMSREEMQHYLFHGETSSQNDDENENLGAFLNVEGTAPPPIMAHLR